MENKFSVRKVVSAIREADLDQLRFLLADNKELLFQITPYGSWLHLASREGQLDVVKFLVDLGLDVNFRGGISGGNALNIAASEDFIDIVRFLHEKGCVLDVDEPERNPLFAAIHNGHYEVAKYLIECGIDASVKYSGENMTNMDALAFAKEWGRSDIVEMLEESVRKL